MDTKGLLFIPDISGFTRFIRDTEIDHSRRIIQELLEVMIDSDRLGLQVSEIEGDAILFFKFGDSPELARLYEQVERTFHDFHARLAAYELTRYCQCRACSTVGDLTLKIVTHYGEFTSYTVRSFEKLIGRDVIVAHQLLKNDIDGDEYWLVTSGLLGPNGTPALPGGLEWRDGVQTTENGTVPFRYAALTPLRGKDIVTPRPEIDRSRYTRMFSASRDYDDHIVKLFHATGDFRYRGRWWQGIRSVEDVSPLLPRIGMSCRRVTDDGATTVTSSGLSFTPDRIEFAETEEETGGAWFFTLESLAPRRTRLSVDYYVKKGRIAEGVFKVTKKKAMHASLERSLADMDVLVGELNVSSDY